MAKRTKIKSLLSGSLIGETVTVMGWVRTFRNNQFIALNDGSSLGNLQIVVDFEKEDAQKLKRLTTSAAISATGKLVASQGKGQSVELICENLEILGDSDAEKYPLQPKKHSLEFLREIAHLRFRTNTFSAVFRIRHHLAIAIHQFFHEKGFYYIHSPIITGSDAEGAGEMFKVTTLPLEGAPKDDQGNINFKKDF